MCGLLVGVSRRLHNGLAHRNRRAIGLELAVRPDVSTRIAAEVLNVAISTNTFQ